MTEIISLKYGVNISKEHVRKELVNIDPAEGASIRKKKIIKRRTYETNGLLMCSILMERINRKGLVSLFTDVLMDLVES